MKKYSFRLFLIAIFTILCIYLLYPTYKDYQNTKDIKQKLEVLKQKKLKENPKISKNDLDKYLYAMEDSIRNADPSIAETRAKRIKLGLDLQGGMYLALEVNTAKMFEKIVGNKADATFRQILKEAEKESKYSDKPLVDIMIEKFKQKGIRLSKYFGSVREDEDVIAENLRKQSDDAINRAMEIIRNRIDQYGVSEPSIQKQGSRRIIVELPGVSKQEEARQLLQGRAQLEFRLVKDPQYTAKIIENINLVLAGKAKIDTTTNQAIIDTISNKKSSDTTKDSKKQTEQEFLAENPLFKYMQINPYTVDGYVEEKMVPVVENLLKRSDVRSVIPSNVEFVFSAKPETFKDGKKYYTLYLLNAKPELTGEVVTNAQANIDPTTNAPIVTMQMNSQGAVEWARITGANIKKRCAIVLDGVVYSAPVIQSKIPSGNSQITGSGSLEEAKILEIILKAGALPAPIDIVEERTVGPSLGQDSISAGFISALLGYMLVAIFMIIYYQKAGAIADVALVLIVLYIMGVLAGFSATLTLPGIAGLVLTMGMAVDANVLIYERIREELALGKTVKAAIKSGFDNSLSAILDSNITTLITGFILYQFGTGPIKGFALTLMIGIFTTLFGALVITRVLIDWSTDKTNRISIG
ncbi:MAG TPA: protein translocase subunit SecD [Ignavibacteriales bacterium]|nr:protein translocase subunit SecD [Ignavibacteriales bacterium]HOL80216.1 protein translocase subunit SecD [Ignavibacteriales bacterium]HOM64497.1 protein translocase subunit SecD [Ignavibacteriales bacterium]HPD66594.1 protein translocase subunit SecD [Ignavibacteriales bacterium]HPP32405.1 protein translocase subunit SecD [Ignavibacteriales bacterium]